MQLNVLEPFWDPSVGRRRRSSSVVALPGEARIASACTRGVIRVPLTVELQLEAQTFPFLPISGP